MNSEQPQSTHNAIGSLESTKNPVVDAFLFWTRSKRANSSLVLGAVIGFVGGAIFHSINLIAFPAIPLALPPFGLIGNILLFSAFGAVIGYACGLPRKTIHGVLLGSLAFFFCSQIWLFLSRFLPYASLIDFKAYLNFYGGNGLVAALYVVPFSIPLRVLIDRVYSSLIRSDLPGLKPKHLWIVLLACALIGYLGLLPGFERNYLTQVNEMVQTALAASDVALYPSPLAKDWIAGSFKNNASHEYQLRIESAFYWGSYLLDYKLPIMQEIVVKFDNGWQFSCGIDYSGRIPYCVGSDLFIYNHSADI